MQYDLEKLDSKRKEEKDGVSIQFADTDEPKCLMNSKENADIMSIDRGSKNMEPQYYCVKHFEDIFGGSIQALMSEFVVLKGLTEKGKKLLNDLNVGEIDKREDEKEAKAIKPVEPVVEKEKRGLVETLSDPSLYTKFLEFMEEKIAIPRSQFPKTFSEAMENKVQKTARQISREMNNMLDTILKIGEIKVIDLDSKEGKTYAEFVVKHLGISGATTYLLVHNQAFLQTYGTWVSTEAKQVSSAPTIIIGQTQEPLKKKKGSGEKDWRDEPFDNEVTFDTSHFPSMEEVYNFSDQLWEYFKWKGVFVEASFIRKLTLAIKKDKSFVLYGEPGDGKSLIVKHLLNWLTYIYNGGLLLNSPDPLEQKYRLNERTAFAKQFPNVALPLNPSLKGKVSDIGVAWESKNIDESTNPLTLYGGFAPETISSGSKELRRKNLELGIISNCIMNGKYCFLDELNRTENEVLGRMMGFLEEPYNYKIDEGNLKIVLKNPPVLPRANWFIIGTMNIGDVGNFKMSSAFKRRFKIMQIHYEVKVIKEILQKVRGYNSSSEKMNIATNLKFICDPQQYENPSDMVSSFLDQMTNMIDSITEKLYETTHNWSGSDNLTQYGVGVAHIIATLDDIALFLYSLFYSDRKAKKGSYLGESDYNADLRKIVSDAIWENVIMSLVDENDKFKLANMETHIKSLIDNVTNDVEKSWNFVETRLKPSMKDNTLNHAGFMDFLRSAWKFGRKD